MSEAERELHDRAIKIRKMTDDQLCACIDREFDRGVDEGKRQAAAESGKTICDASMVTSNFCYEFIRMVLPSIKGIGPATMDKIESALKAEMKHA
jgi:hypothetical protein